MATKRLTMRKTREILRLKWEVGLSHRQVAKSLGISPGAVGSTVSRAQKIGLDWATVAELSEENLELRLGLLVETEWVFRENRRMQRNLKTAMLRLSHVCLEDVRYTPARELDRGLLRLGRPRWPMPSAIAC
jgi:hypothetical protein